MNEEMFYKSKMPVAYYIWIIGSISVAIILILNTFLFQALILSLIFSSFLYVILCRNACSFSINNDKIKVKYYFPLMSLDEIILKPNTVVSYDLGYYYYLNPEHRIGQMQLFYPCDTIYFYQIQGESKILYKTLSIYTSYYSFQVLRKYLNEHKMEKSKER